jgi:hypothetical protein
MERAEQHDAGMCDVEIDGAGEPDRLVELGRGRAVGKIDARLRAPQRRLDDERARRSRAKAGSSAPSNSWTG